MRHHPLVEVADRGPHGVAGGGDRGRATAIELPAPDLGEIAIVMGRHGPTNPDGPDEAIGVDDLHREVREIDRGLHGERGRVQPLEALRPRHASAPGVRHALQHVDRITGGGHVDTRWP